MMECMGSIEMATNGMAVEHNENNISELLRHHDKACIWFRSYNGFAVNKEAVLHHEVRLVQCPGKNGVQLGILQTFVGNCPIILDKIYEGGSLGVVVIGIGLPLGAG